MKRKASRGEHETREDEQLLRLVHHYLLSRDLHDSASTLLREAGAQPGACEDNLSLVYSTYLSVKKLSHSIDFLQDSDGSKTRQRSQSPPRKKQPVPIPQMSHSPPRLPPPPSIKLLHVPAAPRTLSSNSLAPSAKLTLNSQLLSVDGIGVNALLSPLTQDGSNMSSLPQAVAVPEVSEESQKQYTYGWKRYVEYCQLNKLDPLVGNKSQTETSAAKQVLGFARYLMENPDKAVKPAAANSYISAVGKKLVDANVVLSMRDIRTPALKELFADIGRNAAASSASTSSNSTSTGTQATFLSVSRRSCSVGTSTTSNNVSTSTTGTSTHNSSSTGTVTELLPSPTAKITTSTSPINFFDDSDMPFPTSRIEHDSSEGRRIDS